MNKISDLPAPMMLIAKPHRSLVNDVAHKVLHKLTMCETEEL